MPIRCRCKADFFRFPTTAKDIAYNPTTPSVTKPHYFRQAFDFSLSASSAA
jgi:hypothetical protein